MVVFCNLIMGIIFGINKNPPGDYLILLTLSLFPIIGFYFSRTNHVAIGSIGENPLNPIEEDKEICND